MTIRTRIADWISGGFRSGWIEYYQRELKMMMDRTHQAEQISALLSDRLTQYFALWKEISSTHETRLSRIAALDSTTAGETARRMARIARGEE